MLLKKLAQYNKELKNLDKTLYNKILKTEFDRTDKNSLVFILYNEILQNKYSPDIISIICKKGKRNDGSKDLIFAFLYKFIKMSLKLSLKDGVFVIGHLISLHHSVNVTNNVQNVIQDIEKITECFKISKNVNIVLETKLSNNLYNWLVIKNKEKVNFVISSF